MALELETQKSDLVSISIAVEGQSLDESFRVSAIEVDRELNRLTQAKVVLLDGDVARNTFDNSSLAKFVHGKKISISVGFHENIEKIFEGVITSHRIKSSRFGNRIGSYLILKCHHPTVSLVNGRKNTYYKKKKDSEAISKILGDHGLEAEVSATAYSHENLVQFEISDWDFILKRAMMNGCVVADDDDKVYVVEPDFKSQKITFDYGSNVMDFDLDLDAQFQLSQSKFTAWASDKQEVVDAQGAAPRMSTVGALDFKRMYNVGDSKGGTFSSSMPLEKSEMKAWGESLLLYSRLGAVVGRLKVGGNSQVKTNATVKLSGFGDRFSGDVFVAGVSHHVQNGTWLTELKVGLRLPMLEGRSAVLENPYSPMPYALGLQLGTVKKLDGDPKGENRVLVDVPAVEAGGEGLWARVCSSYASDKSGLLCFPNKGDEVVIAYLHGDPRFPIIVGSVYGKKKKTPLEVNAKNTNRAFVTPAGMKFTFDDDKKVVVLETPGGNSFTLDDQNGIVLKDSNGNELKMSSSGITLSSNSDISVSAQQNANISGGLNASLKAESSASVQGLSAELKGQMDAKVEGGVTADLKASGPVSIQGITVGINS